MPGINPNSDAYLIETLALFDQRLRALETQQNSVWKDAEGRERLRAGALQKLNGAGVLVPNGDYGLSYTDVLGTVEELFPALRAYVTTLQQTTSSFVGDPSVTFVASGSGDAEVTLSCTIQCEAAAAFGAQVNIPIYDASNNYVAEVYNILNLANNSTADVSASLSGTVSLIETGVTNLTPGATYKARCRFESNLNSVNVGFYNCYLKVTPI